MSFCKFSQSFISKNQTVVDNAFITEFLPKAPDMCVKAYLLGLFKCNSQDEDNTLEYFSNTLNVCEEDVISLFKYWEEMGLVQVLSTSPIEVRFLPVSAKIGSVKKFKVDKYLSFNLQAQEIMEKHMFLPNEFADFYYLMEKENLQEDALLSIMKFCVENKGFSLSPKYVLTVARDWARDGILTLNQVQEKIKELGVVDDQMSLILASLNSKRKVQLEDKELLNKWLNVFGFDLNVILWVIKFQKNRKRRLDITVLDEILTKYFEMKLLSAKEIENYENEKENLFNVAIAVNKELGIYYEDLTKEIETYVMRWINMGFDLETLRAVADDCFKSTVRTLEGFDGKLNILFKLGVINLNAYIQYRNDQCVENEKVKRVLQALNMTRLVNKTDRDFYATWTQVWNFEEDVILYACTLAKDKSNSMAYLNKILSNWHTQGILKLEEAKKTEVKAESSSHFIHNEYSKEQIKSLISNLEEMEV